MGPWGVSRQQTSNLNFQVGQNIPNLVIVPVVADGKVQLFNGSDGTVHLVADVVAGEILRDTCGRRSRAGHCHPQATQLMLAPVPAQG